MEVRVLAPGIHCIEVRNFYWIAINFSFSFRTEYAEMLETTSRLPFTPLPDRSFAGKEELKQATEAQ